MLARWHAAALALLLLPTAPARAKEEKDEDPYSKPALYASFGGTFAWELFQNEIGTQGQTTGTANNSMGVELRSGYRASPYVAGEIDIDIMDGFNVEAGTQNASLDLLAATLNAKGYLPAGRLQPYLAVGLGYLNLDSGNTAVVDDGNSLVARFASGLDVYLTDNFAVYAGWHYLLPFGSNYGFDTFSAHFGIQYMLRLLEP